MILKTYSRSGLEWVGDQISNKSSKKSKSITFNTPNIVNPTSSNIWIYANIVGRSAENTDIEGFLNQSYQNTSNATIPSVRINDKEDSFANEIPLSFKGASNLPSNTFTIDLKSTKVESTIWIDYAVVNWISSLVYSDQPLPFRITNNIGNQNITEFKIASKNKNLIIWDVTNPTNPINIPTSFVADSIHIFAQTDTIKEFIAFNPANVTAVPEFISTLENQNIHSLADIEYVIIAPNEFKSQAEQLAEIHRNFNNLSPKVIALEQIYNEFSSGKQDPFAIRDFMQMLYEKALLTNGIKPKYLLLYGDGSYNNRGINGLNKGHIVTYQSDVYLSQTKSFSTDDIFGYLDRTSLGANELQLAIGRFPVNSPSEAIQMNKKVELYLTQQTTDNWLANITFLATGWQNDDRTLFEQNAESVVKKIEFQMPEIQFTKLYTDAYTQNFNSQFQPFPELENDLENALRIRGSLSLNYFGHGAPCMTDKNFLTVGKADLLSNQSKLPLIYLATCEAGRYDDPETRSLSEHLVLNPTGGAIATISANRIVYNYQNFHLNLEFNKLLFSDKNFTIAEALMHAKNEVNDDNMLRYIFLGDPALRIILPKNRANITKIQNSKINQLTDTIRALSQTKIEGTIVDKSNATIANFNGKANITVWDKNSVIKPESLKKKDSNFT